MAFSVFSDEAPELPPVGAACAMGGNGCTGTIACSSMKPEPTAIGIPIDGMPLTTTNITVMIVSDLHERQSVSLTCGARRKYRGVGRHLAYMEGRTPIAIHSVC